MPHDSIRVWSNLDADTEAWSAAYRSEFPMLDRPALYEQRMEQLEQDLARTRKLTNRTLHRPILVFRSVDSDSRREPGFNMLLTCKLNECFQAEAPLAEWYIDEYGDLRGRFQKGNDRIHVLYRVLSEEVSPERCKRIRAKIRDGELSVVEALKATDRLGTLMLSRYAGLLQEVAADHERFESEVS